ncbi:MAG: GTPase HflX [Lachnospiraceae bacterium]|nr:GTPase HflX [Lachnospiraceae bacterium]
MAAFFGADEIWNGNKEEQSGEKVILAGVYLTSGEDYLSEDDFEHSLDELGELAKACGMEVKGTVTQRLPAPDQALYVREGKAEEIRLFAEELAADRVLFNDTLSPSQLRNLQRVLKLPVTDRTRLILEIFERRARTREAKLQVELAKLGYLKPRLIGLWETQNRQGGASGSMSSKGEGETQLEIDRRTIDHRLTELRKELKLVSRERDTQKKKRRASHLPLVSLVGYTNAGKSTILNEMLRRWGAGEAADKRQVFEADMLFATLDTTVRKIETQRGRAFLLSDTVGFIHRLPTSLVEAFHSTLEEAKDADLLVQVVDSSDEHWREHIHVTAETIRELGASHIPMITVFNKSDLSGSSLGYPRRGMKEETIEGVRNESIYISAKDPASIDFLTDVIFEKLEAGYEEEIYTIPYDRGDILSFVMENGRSEILSYEEHGTLVKTRCSPEVAEKVLKMLF